MGCSASTAAHVEPQEQANRHEPEEKRGTVRGSKERAQANAVVHHRLQEKKGKSALPSRAQRGRGRPKMDKDSDDSDSDGSEEYPDVGGSDSDKDDEPVKNALPGPADAPGKKAAPDESSKGRNSSEAGVRFSWVREWAEHVMRKLGRRVTTRDVCRKVVVPETTPYNCRYADLLDSNLVGPSQFHVVHTWGESFKDFIEVLSLRLEDNPDAFVWIDIISLDQPKYDHIDGVPPEDMDAMIQSVNRVHSTLFCWDPLIGTDKRKKGQEEEFGTDAFVIGGTLRRIWCIFEVFHTLRRSKGPEALQILTYKSGSGTLEGDFMTLDVTKASASKKADYDWLMSEIEKDCGPAELAIKIKEAFLISTAYEAEQALTHLQQCRADGSDAAAIFKAAKAALTACAKAAELAGCAQRHADAHAHAVKGLELLELLPIKDLRVGTTATAELENCLDWEGRPEEAEAAERGVLSKMQSEIGPKNIMTRTQMCRLVTHLAPVQGRMKDAKAMHEQLVEAAGPNHSLSVAAASVLECHKALADPAEHEGTLRERAEHLIQKHGPGHQKTREVLNDLAANLLYQGKQEEARAVQQQVTEAQSQELERQLDQMGTGNIMSQAAMQNMLCQNLFAGDVDGAITVCKRMLKVLGPGNEMCLSSVPMLCNTLIMHSRHADAEQLVRQPLEHVLKGRPIEEAGSVVNTRNAIGSNFIYTILSLLSTLAKAVSAQNLAETESIQRHVVNLHPKPTGVQHVGIAAYQGDLGNTLTTMEKHEEAEHWFREALNVYTRFMDNEMMVNMAKQPLEQCLRRQGKEAEAAALKQGSAAA